jgi:hypothetical protein
MLHRLISFIRSGNKSVVLKYFYNERMAAFKTIIGKFNSRVLIRTGDGKVNLSGQKNRLYGLHRSGLNSAIHYLKDFHNPKGVLLDAAVDRTFSTGYRGFRGYTEPWIGIIHIPHGVPEWMHSQQSNTAIFNSESWKRSAPQCRGLFTLSHYHQQHLQHLFDFPVEYLLHPVEFPDLTWSFDRFIANPEKKILQTGWWLRRVYSIYLLNVRSYRKIVLVKPDVDTEQHFKLELAHMEGRHRINSQVLDSVTRLNFISNKKYDQLLSENIVFLDLIDASANNAIIECIARNTPVLVNPIEPVVEYLGAGYPFYFNSLEEASQKAENMDLVRETHLYLCNHPIKQKLTGEYFRESFVNSKIYRSL